MSAYRSFLASATAPRGQRASGRQAFALLWSSSRPLSLLVVAWALAGAAAPALVVVALGEVVAAVPGAIRSGLSSGAGHHLIAMLAIAGGVYAFSLILDPLGSALGTAAGARITGALQARLLRAVSTPVGVAHLEDAEVLDRLARAEGSLTGFFPGEAPVTWVSSLSGRLAGVVGCAVISYYVWWLGLLLLAIWLLVRRLVLGGVVRQATELRAQTTAMRRAWYMTGLGSKVRDAKEVRVFGLGDFIAERFGEEYASAMRGAAAGLRDLHVRAILGWGIVAAGYVGALLWIAHAAQTHAIDLRTLAVMLPMLAVTAQAGSVSLDDITLSWALSGLPDADRLESELGAARAELAGREPLDGRPRVSVSCRGLRFCYPNAPSPVLDGLDLELPAGGATAIVGVNGAGKSTLVSLLSRLREPAEGTILVDGRDVRELDPRGWQRNVAVVEQEPARFPFSAYLNVAFGALEHREDREGVLEAAAVAGFAEVAERLPAGWETVLSSELPGGVDLSGGQWQRLALARALFATRHGARLLVLDEPTAALDVRSEARFYERFFDITQDLTTVVISHRFATVRRADTICVLDGGRISERGSHEQLTDAGGTYARMYALQARRFGEDG